MKAKSKGPGAGPIEETMPEIPVERTAKPGLRRGHDKAGTRRKKPRGKG